MGIESPVHLLFIAIVALLVLGPKRLPGLARALGQGIREFRSSLEAGAEPPDASASELAPPTQLAPPAQLAAPTEQRHASPPAGHAPQQATPPTAEPAAAATSPSPVPEVGERAPGPSSGPEQPRDSG